MKPPYVRDLMPNQIVTSEFLVQSKDIRQKKSGEPYLSLLIGDRSGDVDAKMWDNVADVMQTFEREDFVRIKGLYQIFQNRPQITVHKLMRVDDAEVKFADFFPASERDPDEMFAELRGVVSGIGNPHLRALLEAIFADERIARAYRIAPAAKQIHHAYLSGLIEHVLSLTKLAKFTAAHYAGIDVDLLLAGVILHDLGKIEELTYDRGFGYSTDGQLLGHITIGFRIVEEKLRLVPDFPAKLRTLLEHMILSHHGELEYGSPKVPLFAEALLLHHLDNLDSKIECMRSVVEKDRQQEGCWTSYSSPLDRAVLKKLKYLDEPGAPVANATTPVVTAVKPAVPAAPAPVIQTAAAPVPVAPLPVEQIPVPEPASEALASAVPVPVTPRPQPQPTSSLFGDKLKQALKS